MRAPPFPDWQPATDLPPPSSEDHAQASREELFSALCQARVGGSFWGKPFAGPRPDHTDLIVLRPGSGEERTKLLEEHGSGALIVESLAGDHVIDPWSVLLHATKLVAHGDDEWIAIAVALGIEVELLSPGFYGKPDEGRSGLVQRALSAINQPMFSPFSAGRVGPLEAIALLSEWRRVIDANRGQEGHTLVAACGISWWKRFEIKRFLWSPETPLKIFRNASRALTYAQSHNGALAVWPSRISPSLIDEARRRNVPLVRVEDGFVRSVGLGSNLVPPLSVIVDRVGIHFDPTKPSDLETILAHHEFSDNMIERAARLRETLVAAGISKYASGHSSSNALRERQVGTRVVLVTGQVEDDMSVLAGGGGLTSNLELLRRARDQEPAAQIWWRPHPDVDAGHRNGFVDDTAALEFADRIVRDGSMADLLDEVDGVHVLTSLSGFEALLRGRDVTCHGTPFYAGWGLTRDLGEVPERRGRNLTLDQLVAGVLLLYPRYLDPVTGLPCPPEVLIQRMSNRQTPNRLQWIAPLRRAQGSFMARLRRKTSK
ncbi:beta-3-deoxy-D-manno-oct-2-ulosonic acid transferase [Erythrobacter sp. KY5]|nr:beta-3-deoxy-D-manno-oct-2-ulosonic acid transferase [Erythrobacter sp. KY5]